MAGEAHSCRASRVTYIQLENTEQYDIGLQAYATCCQCLFMAFGLVFELLELLPVPCVYRLITD